MRKELRLPNLHRSVLHVEFGVNDMNANYNEFGQPIGCPLPRWVPPPRPSREILTGRFCRLEPLDPARHAAALFAANLIGGAERSWTYLPYGPFPTMTDYRHWMETACLGNDPLFFTIIDLADGHPAGLASYLRIAPEAGSIEVGHLHFSPRLQRKPAATEAMYLLMKQAFALGYRRYEWKCDALNAPSWGAAQRLGLSFEGVFRQATVYKGRNRDTAWFAAIDSEWPDLNSAFQTWLAPDNFDEQGGQATRLSDLTRPILKQHSPRS
ncbi:MAG TPA: GNAT family protein [Candidatus Saccharimonadales bacterium]|nr:GNAT family protein [Candidatus Saccharimonadales bacterium]